MSARRALPRLLPALLAALPLLAQAATATQIELPQRLSAWLNARSTTADDYELGLMWLVDSEQPVQQRWREDLLRQLEALQAQRPDAAAAELSQRLRRMPLTGRVLTAGAHARWLEVNPARDPQLQPGDRIVQTRRPRSITVHRPDGSACAVTHLEAATPIDFLGACLGSGEASPDWVWVIQPDGRMRCIGVAAWNRSAPVTLAPGARLWWPDPGWPEAIGPAVAQWLSWQGPAEDPADPASIRPLGAAALTPLADLMASGQRSVSASDWGFVGLLQTPTARMRPAGSVSASLQQTSPYTRSNIFLQPFEALEFGYRYVDVANRRYGPDALSGSQSYKDKSIDAKLRLLREDRWQPELAVGILDIGGTGLFGSEYLVANKRWGAWDFSLGLGWGYLGHRSVGDNPLALLKPSLKTRPQPGDLVGQGGTPGFSRFFRGPVGLFGGLQYRPDAGPWLIKAELDGNDYQAEGLNNNQTQRWPINLGLVYQLGPLADLSLGLERGNRLSLGFALTIPLAETNVAKTLDEPRIALSPQRRSTPPDWAVTATDLGRQTGWQTDTLTWSGRTLQADMHQVSGPLVRERVERALAVLHRDAPAEVEQLELRLHSRSTPLMALQVDREAWVAPALQPPRRNAPVDPLQWQQGDVAPERPPQPVTQSFKADRVPLRVEPAMDLVQSIGGPDAFILYQLSAALYGTLLLPSDWRVNGNLRVRTLDNYDRFKYDGPSLLPRVRTRIREYLTTSRVTLESLSLNRYGRLGGDHYGALYAGYFESMYGGVGGEWLYRPGGSAWSFGLDLNRVRQRDFAQDLRFLGYRINTGHATLHWDTGWNDVSAHLSVGQYLAGDRGATLTLQKNFANGVAMSVFATRTNVSAAQFGEGSFDKGLVLTLPFDVFMPRSTNVVGHVLWRPLTRDGGAMVGRPVELYYQTPLLDPQALRRHSAPIQDDLKQPDERSDWLRTLEPAR
ncbi:MAG: hypothetical protein RJA44_2340 [Pseudomonadota bacterium]